MSFGCVLICFGVLENGSLVCSFGDDHLFYYGVQHCDGLAIAFHVQVHM